MSRGKAWKVKNVTDVQILRAARRTAYLNICLKNHKLFGYGFANADKHIQMTALDRLVLRTKMPYKVCLRAVERAVASGIVEYGVNITRFWEVEK